MNIEWDSAKNEENKRKHHISFEAASYVFADPFSWNATTGLKTIGGKRTLIKRLEKSAKFFLWFIRNAKNHID